MANMLKAILIFVYCMDVSVAGLFKLYKRLPLMDGFTCVADDALMSVTELKDAACLARCTRTTNCTSVFYHVTTGACHGCKAYYSNIAGLPVGVGTEYYGNLVKYGEYCWVDEQCIDANTACNENKCTCKPGYPFEPSTGKCVTTCDTWGSTYTIYPFSSLGDASYSKGWMLFKEPCMDDCTADPTCRSFDHTAVVMTCKFNTQTARTAPQNYGFDLIYFHYSRNCA